MTRPLSPLPWRPATRGARRLALASVLSLLVAALLLAVEGARTARLDYLVIAATLLLLLAMAWVSTRLSTDRSP